MSFLTNVGRSSTCQYLSAGRFCCCSLPHFLLPDRHIQDIQNTVPLVTWGTAVAQWLRRCATNRKVAGSISAGVIGIFHWYKNPSDRTMALGSAQPITEMNTRSISWGKGGRCIRLTTLPPSCAVVTKSGKRNFLEPSGHLGPVMGLLYLFTT